MVKFSNPRLHAVIADFPLGGNKRGQCTFSTESNKKGIRVGRTTTGKTKWDTYAGRLAIVEGDDGRTYILKTGLHSDMIMISRSDFMDAGTEVSGKPNSGAIFPGEERYAELLALVEAAK